MWWTQTTSTWWKKNNLLDELTDDDLRAVLTALVAAPEIDWHIEQMLLDMSKRIPRDVIALFGQRFARETSLQKDPREGRYEALPYNLKSLAPALVLHGPADQ